ncbi:unnamed protein product [Cuscuta europaea]|uniref:Uncharacterized protein n=1 Tax=Cuscuta europaea TaxID=41803 RepID=A0A9P0ZSD5_CUSEU|nr:unnamed protein product [Cuscuta europaea]
MGCTGPEVRWGWGAVAGRSGGRDVVGRAQAWGIRRRPWSCTGATNLEMVVGAGWCSDCGKGWGSDGAGWDLVCKLAAWLGAGGLAGDLVVKAGKLWTECGWRL